VGPRPKSGKLRLNLHATILERKSIGSNSKKKKDQHGYCWILNFPKKKVAKKN
jgi:hypothetical protein